MNRINPQSITHRARATVSAFRSRAAAVTGTLMFLPAIAMAQADPAAAITSDLSTLKPSVGGIIVILAGVLGLLLLWGYIKRTR